LDPLTAGAVIKNIFYISRKVVGFVEYMSERAICYMFDVKDYSELYKKAL